MARLPAVGFGLVRRHRAGCNIMVELRISPAAGSTRKPCAVFLYEECLRGGVRHIHDKWCLRALLEAPLKLRDLGALRERLSVVGDAGLVSLDHHWVGDDDLEHFI